MSKDKQLLLKIKMYHAFRGTNSRLAYGSKEPNGDYLVHGRVYKHYNIMVLGRFGQWERG